MSHFYAGLRVISPCETAAPESSFNAVSHHAMANVELHVISWRAIEPESFSGVAAPLIVLLHNITFAGDSFLKIIAEKVRDIAKTTTPRLVIMIMHSSRAGAERVLPALRAMSVLDDAETILPEAEPILARFWDESYKAYSGDTKHSIELRHCLVGTLIYYLVPEQIGEFAEWTNCGQRNLMSKLVELAERAETRRAQEEARRIDSLSKMVSAAAPKKPAPAAVTITVFSEDTAGGELRRSPGCRNLSLAAAKEGRPPATKAAWSKRRSPFCSIFRS